MKAPDRFQVLAGEATSWLAARKKQLAVVVAVALALALFAVAVLTFLEARRAKAGRGAALRGAVGGGGRGLGHGHAGGGAARVQDRRGEAPRHRGGRPQGARAGERLASGAERRAGRGRRAARPGCSATRPWPPSRPTWPARPRTIPSASAPTTGWPAPRRARATWRRLPRRGRRRLASRRTRTAPPWSAPGCWPGPDRWRRRRPALRRAAGVGAPVRGAGEAVAVAHPVRRAEALQSLQSCSSTSPATRSALRHGWSPECRSHPP